MKTGQITAKLRDAVQVCLMVEGNEVKRYKNIELPDAIKEIELIDFHFHIAQDSKITFQIHYAPGVLPKVFPDARPKVTRAEKATAKAKAKTEQEAIAATAEDTAPVAENTAEAMPEAATTEEPAAMVETPADTEATVNTELLDNDTTEDVPAEIAIEETKAESTTEKTPVEAIAEDNTSAAPTEAESTKEAKDTVPAAPIKRKGRPRKNPVAA